MSVLVFLMAGVLAACVTAPCWFRRVARRWQNDFEQGTR